MAQNSSRSGLRPVPLRIQQQDTLSAAYSPSSFCQIGWIRDVRIVGEPLNPEDGEQVIAVEAVDLEEAVKRLRRRAGKI